MRRRGLAGGLVALFILVGAVSGASSLDRHFRNVNNSSLNAIRILPGEFPDALRLSALAKAQTLEALRVAWFTNGNEGYFLDNPGGMQNIFSLYDTLWWSRYARLVGTSAEIDTAELGNWVLPLTELRSLGTADTSGAPDIAVLGASVALAHDYRLNSISPSKVVAAFDLLRLGSLYKSSRSASVGDWTSTAIAVQALKLVGASVPEQVRTSVIRNVARAQESRAKAQISLFILPMLSASIDLGEPMDGWRGTVMWLRSIMSSLPMEKSVSIAAQIHEASPAFRNLAMPPDLCNRFRDSVRANVGGLDPHLLADAAEIGCTYKGVTIPAVSLGGWPNLQAKSQALVDTYYGTLLARGSGVLENYARQIAKFNADRSAMPLFALISAIVGCADSPCLIPSTTRTTNVKSLITSLEVCIMHGSNREHQEPSADAYATGSSQNQFAQMIVEELKARCERSSSHHTEASRMANQMSTSQSLELISARSWVLAEPLPLMAVSMGHDLGILKRMVLANWNYTDRFSLPALAF